MNEILHANIFFVITSIATVLFTLIVCLILYNILKMVKSIRRIVERVEAASEQVADDVAHAREMFYNGGMLARIIGFAAGVKKKSRKNK